MLGGESLGKSKPEYVSSAYDPVYDKDTYDEEPGCKKYITSNKGPMLTNIKVEDVKANEDSDMDDSDDELGAMIYESSRTAKKFREEAERKKVSQSQKSNRKSPERESPTTIDNNERTNTVLQGGEPRQRGRQIKEQYPDGTLHITDPGMSGENRLHHHHTQPVGGGLPAAVLPSPQYQYQYPAGYLLQTYVQPFQHQHQQYLYVTTYAVPPGYTIHNPTTSCARFIRAKKH